jgi:hypothetical protein
MPKRKKTHNQNAETALLSYWHPKIRLQNFPPHQYHQIMIEDLFNLTRRRADFYYGSSDCVPCQATATYTNEEQMFRAAFLKIRSEGHE